MENTKLIDRRRGFSLVELLIVIVVIAILAAITIVAYTGITNRAHNITVQSNLRDAGQRIETFNITEGVYPTSPQELNKLVTVNADSYDKVNRFAYCWRGGESPRFALAGRSKSGIGFYYSSRDGMQELESYSTGITDLCNSVGITQPPDPYGSEWYREWGYTNNWAWWVETK